MKPAIHSPDRRRLAKPIVVSLYFTLVLAAASPVIGAPAAVPGRILVKPHPGIAEAQLHGLFRQHNAVQADQISAINVRILNVPEAARQHVQEALQHHPNIEFAEPDYVLEPAAVPNDTYYSSEWHLPKIAAPEAWDTTPGRSSIVIAILDSGVDGNHPDLTSQLVPGWNFYDNNSDTGDVFGHGTLVAGAAAAASNNGTGVASVAGGCRILPIRVSDTNGYASSSAISQGLTWAADKGVRVANLSFANVTKMLSINSGAQYFQSKGGVVIAAAGNDSLFDSTPDNPNFLMVSATDSNDSLATFSNTGNNIDLAAPGVSILTTKLGGSYAWAAGTSLSAPIVAGVAALVLSANPSLTSVQVQDILKQTADDLGPAGWDPSYGWGRVNAYKAIFAAAGGSSADTTAPMVTITSPSAGSTLSGTATINVSATDSVGVTSVEFYINGALAGTNVTGSFSWNTDSFADGSYTLQARAYDAARNIGTSAALGVSVKNIVSDLTSPTVQITSPTPGGIVAGLVSVNVSASDNVGVTKVEWYLDGAIAATNSSGSFSWNTTTCPNGSHAVYARAYDAAGNAGTSATENVTVQNTVADTAAPAVQITSPNGGATVVKNMKVYVTATDNVGVTRVELVVDGKVYSTSTIAAPVFSWNTSKTSRGSHTLQAVAYDIAGNWTRSTPVMVNK